MHGGGNRIYGRHMIVHNGQFAECEVLEIFSKTLWFKDKDKDFRSKDKGTRTRTCKLILEDKDYKDL